MRKKTVILLILTALLLTLTVGCGAGEEKQLPAFAVEFLSTGKSDCILICMDDLVILCDAADADDYPAIRALMKARGADSD